MKHTSTSAAASSSLDTPLSSSMPYFSLCSAKRGSSIMMVSLTCRMKSKVLRDAQRPVDCHLRQLCNFTSEGYSAELGNGFIEIKELLMESTSRSYSLIILTQEKLLCKRMACQGAEDANDYPYLVKRHVPLGSECFQHLPMREGIQSGGVHTSGHSLYMRPGTQSRRCTLCWSQWL